MSPENHEEADKSATAHARTVERLARANRLVDAQADLVERQAQLIARQAAELTLIRNGLSYRFGDLAVHGMTSRAAMRALPERTAGLVRDARGKARARRRTRAQATPSPAAPHYSERLRTEPTEFERARAGEHRQLASRLQPRAMVVATVCDEFTFNCFSPECVLVPLTPKDWREQLDRHAPDLLFVESAWTGVDPRTRPWRGQIYASSNFAQENRRALLEILTYCRRRGIPTAFWNKEDPTHFDDEVHNFAATARLFDHVFTTAEECVDRYRRELGVDHVSVLPFATQPRIFNPFGSGSRSDVVVFAGSWYAQHPERSVEMATILDRIVAHGLDLRIYDRHFDDTDPNHVFPERFDRYRLPSVPHRETARIYRQSSFGLNINTVTTSRSMFARRVFELMSSGTLVLTNHSEGVSRYFPDLAFFVDRDPWPLTGVEQAELERIRRAAVLTVLEGHTYADRLDQVLRDLGIGRAAAPVGITFTHRIASEDLVDRTIDRYRAHRQAHDHLLLVLGAGLDKLTVAHLYQTRQSQDVSVVAEDSLAQWPAGALGMRTSHAAIMDDRPYPPRELSREVRAHLRYLEDAWVSLEPGPAYELRADARTGERVVGPVDRLRELLDPAATGVVSDVHGL